METERRQDPNGTAGPHREENSAFEASGRPAGVTKTEGASDTLGPARRPAGSDCERDEVLATVQGDKARRAASIHTNRNGRDRHGRRRHCRESKGTYRRWV